MPPYRLTQQAVSQHLTVLKRAGTHPSAATARTGSPRCASVKPLRSLLDEFPDALAG